MQRLQLIASIFVLLLMVAFAFAQQPLRFNYQAKLSDNNGDPVADDNYSVEFCFYNDSTGTEPTGTEITTINTNNGFFNAVLGESLDLNALGGALFMEVIVGGEVMVPRSQINFVPYSAISQRLSGDVQTADGYVRINDTMGDSAIVLNGSGTEKGIIIVDSHPQENDGSSISLGIGAEETGIIIVDSKPTEGTSSIGLSTGAEEKGIIIVDSKPGGDSSSIGINTGLTETGIIIVDSKPTEGTSSIGLNTGGAERGIIIVDSKPDETSSSIKLLTDASDNLSSLSISIPLTHHSSAIEISADGTLQKGSIKMFQPQPEPPGQPFLEMYVEETGGGINLQNEIGKYMGIEPSPFHDGGSLLMYGTSEGRTDNLGVEITANSSGGAINLNDTIGRYMGFEPSPFSPGGLMKMTSPSSGDTTMTLTSEGEIVLDNDTNNLETHLTAGYMEMKYSDGTGDGPPIHMETSGTSARVGIGTDLPDNELHIVGNIKIVNGDEGDGKVLTSDANGLATWEDPLSLVDSRAQELIDIIEKQNEKIAQLEERITELEKSY